MNKTIYILVFVAFIGIFALTASPAAAEHATCTDVDDNNGHDDYYGSIPDHASCGVIMSWNWIFENTHSDFEGVSTERSITDGRYDAPDSAGYDFGSSEEVTTSDNLLGPTKGQHRNLYHGIWQNQREYTARAVTGETSELGDGAFSNNYIPWLPSYNNYKPPHLSTQYEPNWWGIIYNVNGEIKFNEDGDQIKLTENNKEFNFTTWSEGEQDIFSFGYNSDTAPIEEDMWNIDAWPYEGEFRPKYVSFNGTVPQNTTIKIEVFTLPEDEDSESSGYGTDFNNNWGSIFSSSTPSADQQISENPEEYKVGEAEIVGSGGIQDQQSAEVFYEPLTHNDGENLGLSEYQKPKYDEYNGGLFGPNNEGAAYHIRLKMERDSTSNASPKIGLANSITLSEEPPTYRSTNAPWGHYPQILSTFSGDVEGRELLTITNQEDSAFEDKVLGHTEDMLGNFENEYLGDPTSSYAPKIPREDLNEERFYHSEVTSPDYHLIDEFEFLHHAYADIPRVERSYHYQEEYEDVSKDDWKTLASDEGSIYALFDVATNNIQSNSNFNHFDHEDSRYYNSLSEADIPDYSKSSYSADDLKSEAIRINYEIDSVEIKPKIGIDYEGYEDDNFIEGEYTPIESKAVKYDQGDIVDGSSSLNGFYASISNVRVNYSISYEVLKFQTNSCPSEPDSWTPEFEENPVTGENEIVNWPSSPVINSAYSDEDSDIYSGYTDYVTSQYSNSLSVDSVEGRASCGAETDQALGGTYWSNTDWDYVEDIVNHDDEDLVSYELDQSYFSDLTDDGIEEQTRHTYEIDKFASERAEEQGPDSGDIGDSFKTEVALGQDSFGSRTHFDRNIQDHGVDETRWSRAEAVATLKRNTMRFDLEGGNQSRPIFFGSESGLGNTYTKARDYSSEVPLPGRMTEDMEVYLDVYNYGPSVSPDSPDPLLPSSSSSDDKLTVKADNTTIYDGYMQPTGDHMRYVHVDPTTYEESSVSSSEHTFNLTEFIEEGDSTLNLNFTYEGGLSAEEYDDIDQRIDYVVRFETGRPVEDIYSRWDYTTFRDDRYDVTYEFKDQECATNDDIECYDYESHGLPFTTLDEEERGQYNSEWQESPPDEVNTYYPSQSMFVRPYLTPTTSTIATTDPSGIGTRTKPVQLASDYIEDTWDVTGNSQSDNMMDQSNIQTSVEGGIEQYNLFDDLEDDSVTFVPKEKFEDPPIVYNGEASNISFAMESDESYVFVSEDIHHKMRFTDPDTREEEIEGDDGLEGRLEHVDVYDFPATSIKHDSGSHPGEFSIESTSGNGYGTTDLEVQDTWFEDGRYYVEVSPYVDSGTTRTPKLKGSFGLRILDFPEGYIGNWRDWGSISDTQVQNGLLFGGHDKANLDSLRDDNDDFWQEKFNTQSTGIFNFIFFGDATYEGNSEFWLVDSQDVESTINSGDNPPIYLDYMDYSPLSSNYCPKDHSRGMRYCNLAVDNIASFNAENSIIKNNTNHLRSGYIPVDSDVQEEPYVEYGEFEYISYDNYASWNFAGDASWETRPVEKDKKPKLFDNAEMEIQPVEDIEEQLTDEQISEYQSSDVDHSFATGDDENKQQYKLKLTDNGGNPISLSQRHENIFLEDGSDMSLPDIDEDAEGVEEGICIDVQSGSTGQLSKDCYLTDTNGTLYFYVESYGSQSPSEALQEVQFEGSEEYWWKYVDGQRMLESASINMDDLENTGSEDEATLGDVMKTLLIVIVIFAFVVAMMSRIRMNPSNGWSTKDVLNTMFKPFIGLAIKRLGDILLYLILVSIGFGTLVAAFGSGDMNPFFVLEFVLSEIASAIANFF